MNFEKILALLWLLSLPVYGDMNASLQPTNNVFDTIVIDAGHGGKDGGCQGKHSSEKHIALAIALQLGKRIENEMPGVKVIYTRDKDVFIPLDDRARIANENSADLFICIHCNAVITNKEAIAGTETYTMGMHVKESNLDVASRENGVIAYEDDYEKKYEGYNPNSTEGHILLSMYQSAYIQQSLDFASKVEAQFAKIGRKSRGVFQAGFLVLRKTAMPSVLIETGYLTNTKEEGYLASEEGKKAISNSIFQAVKEYKHNVEKTKTTPVKDEETKAPPAKVVVAKQPVIIKKEDPKPIQTQNTTPVTKLQLPTTNTQQQPPATPNSTPKTQPPTTKSAIKVTEKSKDNQPITFSICLMSSPTVQDTTTSKWKKVGGIIVKKYNGRFEYYTKYYTDYYAALRQEGLKRENGFTQAFLKAFKGENTISVVEAKEKLGIRE